MPHRDAHVFLIAAAKTAPEPAPLHNPDVYRLHHALGWASGVGLLILADAVSALAAPRLAGLLIGPAPTLTTGLTNWLAYAAFTVGFMLFAGLYAATPARAPLDHAPAILRTLIAAHVVILLRLALLRTAPTTPPVSASIAWAATAFTLAAGLILGTRTLIAVWWRHAERTVPRGSVALVIAGPCDRDLRARLDRLTGRNLGYLFAWGMPQSAGLRVITAADTFAAMIRAGTITDILVFTRRSDDAAARRRIDALLASLADQPVRVRLAFDAVAEIGAGGIAQGQSLRMVTVLDRPIRPLAAAYKRGFDLLGATVLLTLFGPLMGVIALLLAPSGAILFRQRRIGLDGAPFTVFKFRTMRTTQPTASAPLQARRDDRRITPIGAILRRLSLDELPQIFNVLRGDMSLVGPRPHAPHTSAGDFTFEQAIEFYGVRHRVKPGLTGLAQVRGLRGPTDHPDMIAARVAADLDYIERWSPSLDLAILLRTIPAVIGGRNAF
ncbi:exopolysaccharide biosynthesis polyprenyl glycosylphosphotransferase [Acidiphilium sp. PA]|uniref:exopolysaccharide biosynthesis polyprenyl glycosylphosphotransferase n=1 Tax=Acidiphilium sp. PA TaxID=2871705 RepID=UPI00224435AB|nr:exopolysaccharide biosynthesis polyprenyl glycosylphosphotransferase [Acidiphilium sp. PA]MCW8306029.1 exopolysaccharide biosynthesis polyprenyl glycosylphosphotransferase [Acidiphilium sp. PA]